MPENTRILLTTKSTVEGSIFVGEYTFKSGNKVPLYELQTIGAFNQLIGHAKFNNSSYGNVYYRGVDGLYDNVLPSLMRGGRRRGTPDDLNTILQTICSNSYFKESLKLRSVPSLNRENYVEIKRVKRFNKYTVEAMLQHYAGKTRFLDVVDNHWIALWMGLNSFERHGHKNMYYKSHVRTLSVEDICEAFLKKRDLPSDIYVYILLISMPFATVMPEYGITETDSFVEVDLRKSLPSIYLRPHAQHALVIRKRDRDNTQQLADYYDMSSEVIGILRVRIDLASKWLGNGLLLSVSNLFPSPSIDQGYNNLLLHDEVFKHPFEIMRYF